LGIVSLVAPVHLRRRKLL